MLLLLGGASSPTEKVFRVTGRNLLYILLNRKGLCTQVSIVGVKLEYSFRVHRHYTYNLPA
jgi:hypothetical protein